MLDYVYFNKMLSEVSKTYSLDKSFVVDILLLSMSDVITASFGFLVLVNVSEEALEIRALIKQHGVSNEFLISPKSIKKSLMNKIQKEFQLRLDLCEVNANVNKYMKYKNSIVRGKVTSYSNNEFNVEIDNLYGITAICHRRNVLKSERGKFLNSVNMFYVINVLHSFVEGRVCFKFLLSRQAKQIPVHFIKTLSNDKGLKVICIYRKAGVVTYLKSNKKIRYEYLDLLKQELNGELVIVKPLEQGGK